MPYTLAFKDRYLRVEESLIESDTSNSIAFASIPDDTPTKLAVEWTGKQYTKLVSAVMTGAQLMFPEEANEIIWQLIKVVHQPITLEDEDEDGCINYLPSAPFVSFSPQNPYNQPDYVPPDYEAVPFKVNSDLEYPEYLGYQATDVMVNSAAFSIDPIVIATLNFPQFVLRVVGAGQIEIDLLTITAGGLLVYKIGEPPNIVDIIEEGTVGDDVVIVDLNNDSVGVPPESDIVSAQEINIDAASGVVTLVYFVFLPVLDDSLIPLRFGGGVRQIGLCGFETEAGGVILEDIRFNTENCTFEKRVLGEWSAIDGGDEWLLCVPDGGGDMATEAEIKRAFIEAQEELAGRLISGTTGNLISPVLIGTDGKVEKQPVGQADNPATPARDEALESKCGGVIAVEKGFNELLDFAYLTFGTDATIDNTRDDFRYLMATKYDCDATLMDAAVEEYCDRRSASAETINSVSVSALQNKLFSKGNLKSTIVNYILSLTGNSLEARQACILFVQALNQSQLETWFGLGAEIPSNLYLGYASSKLQVEEFELDMSTADNLEYPTFQLQKPNHRSLFEVSGKFTSSAYPDIEMDFFYHIDLSTGIKTYTPSFFAFICNSLAEPAQSQVPYSPSGIYAVTLDHLSAPFGGGGQMYIARNNDYFDFADVTGILTCKLTDLGEYV